MRVNQLSYASMAENMYIRGWQRCCQTWLQTGHESANHSDSEDAPAGRNHISINTGGLRLAFKQARSCSSLRTSLEDADGK